MKVTMRLKVVNLKASGLQSTASNNGQNRGDCSNSEARSKNFPTESGAAGTPSCPLPSFPPLMPTSKSTESAG